MKSASHCLALINVPKKEHMTIFKSVNHCSSMSQDPPHTLAGRNNERFLTTFSTYKVKKIALQK